MDNRKSEREALQRIEAIECLRCTHEGVMITDAEGSICDINPACERMLEAPSLSLLGSDIRTLCAVPSNYDDIRHQAETDGRSIHKPILLNTAGGKRKLVNIAVQKVGEKAGLRYVHVLQDCADLRTMEERLLQAERLATIGKFASQIAHEIRNPLSSISLNVELLEDELPASNSEASNLIRSILRELDRLNDIVGEYLQFSRFPKPHLKRGRVDEVIAHLAESLNPSGGVALELALMPDSPEVWLDDRLLRQVLDNLIRNAVEAMNGSGTIRVETDTIDRFLVIRVKDNGRGIPPEIQPKLFEPFFTTKAQGTGLGLATSQQIIFEHNGHLLVESHPGQGSTFSILLPL